MALEPEDVEPEVEAGRVTGRRILINAGYRTIADIGSKIISIALYVVMARRLGEAKFGVFSFGLSFVALVTTLGDFGQDRILTREVSRRPQVLKDYLANTLALKVTIATPALLIATGVLTAMGSPRETRMVVLLLGAAVILEFLMSTIFAVFQAFERLGPLPVVLISQRSVTAAAAIVALVNGADVVAVAAIYLGGAALAVLMAAAFLYRFRRPTFRIDLTRWWPLMRAALPVGLAGVFSSILSRVDMAMLSAYRSDAVVGNYGAAYRLLETTMFLSWSVGAAVYPVFSRLSRTSDPPVSRLYERSLQLLVALTLPLAVGAAVLARPLIELLYTAEFDRAADALLLLSPSIALFPINYLTGYLLVSQHRQIVSTYTFGIVAVENILLNLLLIPLFSLSGAAAGTTISGVLVALVMVTFAQRTVGKVDWRRVLLSAALGSIVSGAVMFLLNDSLFPAIAIGAIVYLAVFALVERTVFGTRLDYFVDLARGSTEED